MWRDGCLDAKVDTTACAVCTQSSIVVIVVVPRGQSGVPAAVTALYDGPGPPRSVTELMVYCGRKWLNDFGWRMVEYCVDTETKAFMALNS